MFGGFQVGAFQPLPAFQQVAAITQAHAGRRRRRYVVEIDGQDFVVEGREQAVALLDRARETAVKAAELAAEALIEEALPRAVKVGKADRVKLKAPTISGPVDLLADIKRADTAIRKIYEDASLNAELRLLMLLRDMRDEEEAITLLLLSD